MLLLLHCIADEGVYVDTYGKISKNVVLQWGEPPTSVGLYYIVSALVTTLCEQFVFHMTEQ